MEGEGLASEFHCRGIEERGQTWWVPKHAVGASYNKIKEHARKIAAKCFDIISKEHDSSIALAFKAPNAGPRYLMAAIIQKCSGFTLKDILCQPYKRSHRQALAKFMCRDLMIGRITRHWYCKGQRVNGMEVGCIDCYKEKNLKVEESEEHLIFDLSLIHI